MPTWTWAVAAGLLVAVAGPLVLLQQQRSAAPPAPAMVAVGASPAPERDAVLSEQEAPPATLAPPPARQALPEPKSRVYTEAPAGRAAPPVVDERAKERDLGKDSVEEGLARPAPSPLPAAPPPPAAAARPEAFGGAPAPAATPAPRLADERPGAPAEAARRKSDDEALGRGREDAPADVETRVQGALGPAKKAETDRAEARKRAESNRGGMAAGARSLSAPVQQQFDALAGRGVRTAEEARSLREDWRGFALQHAANPLADEAQVRTVAAGVDAYRIGGEAADLAQVRADAKAYLAGPAPQRARVRALVRELGLDLP
jgi:hypothetical protein